MTSILCPNCSSKLPLGNFSANFTGIRFDTGCLTCNIPVYWERTYEDMARENAPQDEPMVKLIEPPKFTDKDVKILRAMRISLPDEEAA